MVFMTKPKLISSGSRKNNNSFSLKSLVRSLSRARDDHDQMGAAAAAAADQISSCNCEIRKGYVPVMVGTSEDQMTERFLIKTELIKHPSIIALLELSADEFGYQQEGVLQIPCQPDFFRDTIKSLSKAKAR
ncbi:hypothetical protein Dimus_020041 [Dionaea muscipula]